MLLISVLDAMEKIEDSIKSGTFVPFLGAGCPRLPSKKSILSNEHNKIIKRIKYLLEICKERKKDKVVYKYISSFLKKPEISEMDHNIQPYYEEIHDSNFVRTLNKFQIALAKFGANLTILLNKHMSISPCVLYDLSKNGISMTIDDDLNTEHNEVCDLCIQIISLIDLAAALRTKYGPTNKDINKIMEKRKKRKRENLPDPLGFSAKGIYQRLLYLCVELFVCHRYKYNCNKKYCKIVSDWRKKHEFIWATIPDYSEQKHTDRGLNLKLIHLEWIGNLFWHTLRFDLGIYPSTAELAFQISLCESSVPPRTATLSLASLTQSEEKLLEKLDIWFQYYQTQYQEPSELHLALAVASDSAFNRVIKNKNKNGDEENDIKEKTDDVKKVNADRESKYKTQSFLLYTTNYDIEQERAFEKIYEFGGAYHVIIPVYAIKEAKGEIDPRWLLRTCIFSRHENAKRFQWELIFPNGLMKFYGPAVVKLHGSPRHTLPSPKVVKITNKKYEEELKEITRFRHRIVISEKNYLQDIILSMSLNQKSQENLPDILKLSLSHQRPPYTLCFLGHSVSDSNIRLRLYEQSKKMQLPAHNNASVILMAINKGYDPYQKLILRETMGIDLVDCDLAHLVVRLWENPHLIEKFEALREDLEQ